MQNHYDREKAKQDWIRRQRNERRTRQAKEKEAARMERLKEPGLVLLQKPHQSPEPILPKITSPSQAEESLEDDLPW